MCLFALDIVHFSHGAKHTGNIMSLDLLYAAAASTLMDFQAEVNRPQNVGSFVGSKTKHRE